MEFAPTDYDLLVRRGFDPEEASQALRLARGNMRHALCFLARQSAADAGWMEETDEDWLAYTPTSALSLSANNRALIKSPLYIRVPACVRVGENVFFKLIIIERSGRQHECQMRLSELYNLRDQLPHALISPLNDKLPSKSLTWKGTPEGVERKRVQVEDWLRALCASEECMTSKALMQKLRAAFGIPAADEASGAAGTPSSSSSGVVRLVDNRQDWEAVPEHSLSSPLPIKINVLATQVPCKVPVSGVFRSPEDAAMVASLCAGEADASDEQLAKDYARDRLVVNGKRMIGSMHKAGGSAGTMLVSLLGSVQEVLTAVLQAAGSNADKFSPEQLRHFCYRALKQASRTNSAFLSHMGLHQVVALEEYPGDLKIVPESTLAKPLLFNFAVSVAPIPNAPPVLKCDIQGTSVYRFCVGDDLEPILQLRVTYCKTLREMPQRPPAPLLQGLAPAPAQSTPPPPFQYKNSDSEAILVLQRDTTTTSHDWKRVP